MLNRKFQQQRIKRTSDHLKRSAGQVDTFQENHWILFVDVCSSLLHHVLHMFCVFLMYVAPHSHQQMLGVPSVGGCSFVLVPGTTAEQTSTLRCVWGVINHTGRNRLIVSRPGDSINHHIPPSCKQ